MRMAHRKTPHFFIINPVKDRRIETRFESNEPIQIRFEDTGKITSGQAADIAQRGMRLSSAQSFLVGDRLQIVFVKQTGNIGCFGRVAWCRPAEEGARMECGVAVESWHGIVNGAQSWKKLKGVKPRFDRRQKER